MINMKTQTIYTKGFIIHYAGDPSVGIFPATWEITGGFYFEDKQEFETFKEKLRETWEYCSDTPIGIGTFEQHEETIKEENEMFKD